MSRSTQENEKITTDELRTRTTFQQFLNQDFFWFTSSGFLKRPVSKVKAKEEREGEGKVEARARVRARARTRARARSRATGGRGQG
jgi:hypothetical protein